MAKRINERVRKKLIEAYRVDPVPPHVSPRVIRSVDANSPSFGKDLEHIFRLNVARARRDNKRIVGVADLAPRKR